MNDETPADLEGRVLLLAPTTRDAEAAARLFEKAGIALTRCADLAATCAEIGRGAAVAIVPDEAILNDRDGALARVLAQQPAWSDFPLIVMSAPHRPVAAARRLESVGHMTLLARPVEIRTLLSTVQAALRDRRRQYARREDFAELRRQAEALRENDRQKDEFLAMLAHELRNPLAAIANAAQVARRSDAAEHRDWSRGVIEGQVRNLSRMIDDLLDVSRITRGKVQLRKQPLDLGVIVASAVEAARPLIEEKRHRLVVDTAPGPLRVDGDPTRLEQVLVNLLNNAAKYTEPGGRIALGVRAEGGEAVLRVEDNGAGMPPELIARAFDLFAQGDRTIARSEGGLGIGLTLVKRLVEMHGGTVSAASDGPGLGSVLTVRFPLAPEPVDGEVVPPAPVSRPASGGSSVLVVDDSFETARGMARLLNLLGHEVWTAHDGPSALEEARIRRPDVILLDIGLPGMDGYRVARNLRDEGFDRTVIIAVTGYGQDQAQALSRESGIDHHLVKPVDFESLIALIGGMR